MARGANVQQRDSEGAWASALSLARQPGWDITTLRIDGRTALYAPDPDTFGGADALKYAATVDDCLAVRMKVLILNSYGPDPANVSWRTLDYEGATTQWDLYTWKYGSYASTGIGKFLAVMPRGATSARWAGLSRVYLHMISTAVAKCNARGLDPATYIEVQIGNEPDFNTTDVNTTGDHFYSAPENFKDWFAYIVPIIYAYCHPLGIKIVGPAFITSPSVLTTLPTTTTHPYYPLHPTTGNIDYEVMLAATLGDASFLAAMALCDKFAIHLYCNASGIWGMGKSQIADWYLKAAHSMAASLDTRFGYKPKYVTEVGITYSRAGMTTHGRQKNQSYRGKILQKIISRLENSGLFEKVFVYQLLNASAGEDATGDYFAAGKSDGTWTAAGAEFARESGTPIADATVLAETGSAWVVESGESQPATTAPSEV